MSGRLSQIEDWEQLAEAADFQPAKMAALYCISERQMQRFFGLHFQTTPSHWLRKLQCRMAKELIAQGYSNKAAAAELKFASPSHFCREFKKAYGNSPQTFAAIHLNAKMSLIDKNVANGHSSTLVKDCLSNDGRNRFMKTSERTASNQFGATRSVHLTNGKVKL